MDDGSVSMLAFENVSFRYPGDAQDTIANLSFSVGQGEFVSLVGASGCGKSTIFRLINGLLSPDAGEIAVEGKPIAGRRGYCGYMPQRDLLFPWRTVGDNLRLPMEIAGGVPRAEQDAQIDRVLAHVGLSGWRDKRPAALSGGMRQRAAFARTLLTGSPLLLLDEPFSALDYLTRVSLQEWLLGQWQDDRKTLLFITHDVEEALFLSGRVLIATQWPITALQAFDVPAGYPRTRECLARPEMLALREKLISMLREGSRV